MVNDLVKRNRELEEENQELRALRESLQRKAATLEAELKNSEMRRDYLQFQIEKLKRILFGKRSEKVPARDDGLTQLELFGEAKEEIESGKFTDEDHDEEGARKKRRRNRRPLPKDLHRERVDVDVDPELRVCPDCGDPMCLIGEDIAAELEYIPALLFIIEYALKKYACKKCQNGVIQAKLPPRPIPRARPGPGLLAFLLVSKYEDHLPLNRLERIFRRTGMEISRKTLCDWVQSMGKLLLPIVEAMKRELLKAKLLQVDETPTPVKDPEVKGKISKYWLWTYGIPDAEVIFDFQRRRAAEGPEQFLGDYRGKVQSDGYSVYGSLERRGRIVRIGCWAHARRGFYDGRNEDPEFAQLIIAAIQKLYRIERHAKRKEVRGEALVALRRRESLPILEELKKIFAAKRGDYLPESGLGGAIKYALNNWVTLLRYVDIAEAPIDNTGAERSIRPHAVGRNNWLFVGHPNAGPRVAVIMSLIETCRRLGAEPFKYLKSVIADLAKDPQRASELTPRKWLGRERATASENSSSTSAE